MESASDNATTPLIFGATAIHTLRRAMEQRIGGETATILQEAGYASGNELYDHFTAWLPTRIGVVDPGDLDVEKVAEVLSSYLREAGWGTVELENIGESVVVLTSSDWAEADATLDATHPSCFFSTGMLTAFMSRISDAAIAAMEVDCRSQQNHERCTFLLGAHETLQAVYNAIFEGRDYRSVFTS